MDKFELIAPCHFGMEAVLKREILDLGYEITKVEDGKVTFQADAQGIADANMFLRSTERILLKVAEVKAQTFDELFQVLDGLKEMNLSYQLLFIEAADEDIVRRYKETRHTHPLTRQGYPLPVAVKLERVALEPVRRRASHILNSTGLNLSKFRGELLRLFGMGSPDETMTVSVTSFGFKYGIPIDADLVFDVRFLPNPYYIAELKECTGLEEAVRSFLFGYRQTTEFLRHLEELFAFLLPQYVEEGKSSLVIAIGCTGGHHRSVAVAHAVTEFLRQKGYRVEENHRDISR